MFFSTSDLHLRLIYPTTYLTCPPRCLNFMSPPKLYLPYPQWPQSSYQIKNTIHADAYAKKQRIIFRLLYLSSFIHSVAITCQFYFQNTSRIWLPLTTSINLTLVEGITLSYLDSCKSFLSVSSLFYHPYLNIPSWFSTLKSKEFFLMQMKLCHCPI